MSAKSNSIEWMDLETEIIEDAVLQGGHVWPETFPDENEAGGDLIPTGTGDECEPLCWFWDAEDEQDIGGTTSEINE